MSKQLRYRDNSGGITRKSLIAAKKNLSKIGGVKGLRGYRFISTRDGVTTDRESVLVIGEKGTARFDGFLWGYCGEGPRGLVQLLKACGLNNMSSYNIAFLATRTYKPGIDWELNFPVPIISQPEHIVV